MNKMDLYIKYSLRGKREKVFKLTPSAKTFIFGNSFKAQVVLNGNDVSPLHSAIECRDGKWYLLDLSSESGTWINDEAVAEEAIEENTTFRVGQHVIMLEPKPVHVPLYTRAKSESGGKDFHEVVVRGKKGVLDAVLLECNESYHRSIKGKDHTFKPPKSGEWVETQVDSFTVYQRLVKAPPIVEGARNGFNFEFKNYHMIGAGVLAAFILVIALFPGAPKEEEEKKPVELNTYTKLIYDKNTIKEKRKQAMTITKDQFKEPKKSQAQTPTPSADTRKQAQSTPKVITNIKASGISQLLGKIAMRQNVTNKNFLTATGSTEYDKARGVAGSAGSKVSVSGVSGGVNAGTTKGYQLAAIGTKGLGGGGNIKGYGTISNGGIGTADVGVVEEEADVGGGLDKDAVAAVIKANIGQIRFCYERKLTANPNLYGKVLVQFSIEGQGSAMRPKVARTTLSDTDVEGCILRRLSQWKFPTPPSGTSVLVTYPFLFKSTQ